MEADRMKVVATLGTAGVGKSHFNHVLRKSIDGGDRPDTQFEASDVFIRIANEALTFCYGDPRWLEWWLLTAVKFSLNIQDRAVPDRRDLEEFLTSVTDGSIVRQRLDDWYGHLGVTQTVSPGRTINRENKARHRACLSWLSIFGREWADDRAIFFYPLMEALHRSSLTGIGLATVGGVRYPEEVAALRREFDTTIIKIVSRRVPEDSDPSNAYHRLIVPDSVYHADFSTPEESERYVAEVIVPDLLAGQMRREYGPL